MIDKKYTGVITKADGTIVNDWIVFRAKDTALPDTLKFYYKKCKELGASEYHLAGIEKLLDRVMAYREKYSEHIKVPDTVPSDQIFDASEER